MYLTVKDYSEKYNIPMIKVCARIKSKKLQTIQNEQGVTMILVEEDQTK